MIQVIDHTLNEVLRRGGSAEDIEFIAPLLQKYPVLSGEISLPYWRGAGGRLKRSALLPWLRCQVHDEAEIARARQWGFTRLVVGWRHQPENPSWDRLNRLLDAARPLAREVSLCLENASCFSTAQLQGYAPAIREHGLEGFIYREPEARLDPWQTVGRLRELKQVLPCPLEFQGNNGCGLATANSLAALRAGADRVGTAVSGIGLPGPAPMEELFMAVRHLWKDGAAPAGFSLAGDCARILARAGIEPAPDKALIGPNVFAHESGIHVDGVAKNPALYEVIRPEEVGLQRRLIIGKHSGTAALKIKFRQWNLSLNQAQALSLLDQVREIASAQKSPLSDGQLWQLFVSRAYQRGRPGPYRESTV